MSIRETTPDVIKAKMRTIKTLPAIVKQEVYGGCGDPGATMQFNSDIQVYNLWEALLYVEGYEPQYYVPGTAKKAIDAFMTMKGMKNLLNAP